MSGALALVWIGSVTPTPAAEAAAEHWASARGVSLEAPVASSTAPSIDLALADRIEAELDEARLAASRQDLEAASLGLDRIEASLLAHPELPQAAWLLAERHRALAELRTEAGDDPSIARALERAAMVLEGPRAVRLGQTAVAAPSPPRRRLRRAPSLVGLSLELDGALVPGDPELASGQHQLRVFRGERLKWAGFVTVPADATWLDVTMPAAIPCDADDLGEPRLQRGVITPPPQVRCEAWAAAVVVDDGALIARCNGSSCGVPTRWRRAPSSAFAGGVTPGAATPRVAWTTWLLAGTGAALLGGFALWQSGVFERGDRPPREFVYVGPRAR